MNGADVFIGYLIGIITTWVIVTIVEICNYRNYKKAIQPGTCVYKLSKDLCNEFDEGLPLVGIIEKRSKNQVIIRYTDNSIELYDISMMYDHGYKVIDAKIYNKIKNS